MSYENNASNWALGQVAVGIILGLIALVLMALGVI